MQINRPLTPANLGPEGARLAEVLARHVTITDIHDERSFHEKKHFMEALAALRAVVPNVVEVNTTHEKVVVIDEHTVMLGSLNALSQQRSREVVITMRGHHWAQTAYQPSRRGVQHAPQVRRLPGQGG